MSDTVNFKPGPNNLLHYSCRTYDENYPTVYPRSNINRTYVPDKKVSFSVEWPDYKPIEYTSPKVLEKPPWADPVDKSNIKWNEIDGPIDRRSFLGRYKIDHDGSPLNPIGRTGIKGRGLLGKWGPNHAADPIVTRWKRDDEGIICRDPDSGDRVLQFVSIRRRDCDTWAIPGGMRDNNEKIHSTLKREFMEEAFDSNRNSDEKNRNAANILDKFFENGFEVYTGYCDDPRNTDNSWIETLVYNFHDECGEFTKNLKLTAGDDAGEVKWHDIKSDASLYCSHIFFIRTVALMHQAHWE